jgi:hypothetical protein
VVILLQEQGCDVDYWAFPAPTLYTELKHIGSGGYTSKLAEFEAFVDRVKLKSLQWQPVAGSAVVASATQLRHTQDAGSRGSSQTLSQPLHRSVAANNQSSILVLSDFPHLQSPEAREQFRDMLGVLVRTCEAPTIILVPDSGTSSLGLFTVVALCANHAY